MSQDQKQQTTDQQRLLEMARPVIDLLQGPDTLPNFLTVVRNLKAVLDRADKLKHDSDLRKRMGRAYGATLDILAHQSEFESHFQTSKHIQDPLRGYMGTHPMYCALGYSPTNHFIEKQWFAMTAALLPVADRLVNGINRKFPKDWAFTVSFLRSIRYLAQEQSEVSKEVLLELSNEAQSTTQFLSNLERVIERYSLKVNQERDTADLWYVRRALTWYESGNERVISFHRYENQRRSSRTEGRLKARKNTTHSLDRKLTSKLVPYQDEDGTEYLILKFFDQPHKAPENSIDQSVNSDTPEATAALTLPSFARQDPNRVLTFYLQNRAKQASHVATYAARAIEMGNQRLPIHNNTLTAYEREIFMCVMLDTDHPIWTSVNHDRNQLAAWGLCRFLLSREPELLKALSWRESLNADRSDSKAPYLCARTNRICLPAVGPKHKAPPPNPITIPTLDSFELKLPDWFLRVLLAARTSRRKTVFNDLYEPAFIELLNFINRTYGTELSSSRIERAMPEKMSQLAPADRVISTYFLGQPPNQHIPSVYSAVPVIRLQTLFDQAWSSLCRASALVNDMSTKLDQGAAQGMLNGLVTEHDPHVGSKLVPKASALAHEIRLAAGRLENHRQIKQAKHWVRHNDYTAFTALFVLSSTGVRFNSGLLPTIFDIDPQTGMTFVSDKDEDDYSHARLVWMHPALVKHLQLYQQHVAQLRQILAITSPDEIKWLDGQQRIRKLSSSTRPSRASDLSQLEEKSAPHLFSLNDTYQIRPITNLWLCQQVSPDWEIRLASIRHFVRTSLLQFGISGEVIDALMGHADRGTQPWGPFSTMPPLMWREQLSQALDPILTTLGLSARRSPLFDEGRSS